MVRQRYAESPVIEGFEKTFTEGLVCLSTASGDEEWDFPTESLSPRPSIFCQ